MPTLEDLTIEPVDGSKSLFHGYLGVTPVVTVSGIVRFEATRSVSIASIKITLLGDLAASISGNGEWRPQLQASPPHGAFINAKKAKKVILEQTKILLAPASADAKKKSDRSVPLKAGTHSFPFEFTLSEKITASLPPSLSTEWSENGSDAIGVNYKLEAEVGLAPGLFGSTIKTERVVEPVDFPRIDVPTVLRGEGADTGVMIAGLNEKVEWRVGIDKAIFGLKEPVKFTIHHVRPVSPRTNITSVTVAIRQDAVISLGEGLTRVVRELISVPDVSGRVIPRGGTGKSSGPPTWIGEVFATIDATHWRSKKDHRTINALQDTYNEIFSIRHAYEICIKIKGEPDLRVEAPCVFIDADADVRAWVVRNAAGIQADLEE
ncbi:hypothetical protein HDU67_005106 [Dinochytrium kinnereticum]|nr:hypothetical protein HDU67_005106 [Dinochytrium kinnereticum]